jgi:Cdc6-like AAA superfamily ATPase
MIDYHDHRPPSMNQRIFEMGLPVETISVYLLCCGFTDTGKTVSFKNLLEVWNGSKDQLEKGLRQLEEKNILKQIISDASDNRIYQLVENHCWRND